MRMNELIEGLEDNTDCVKAWYDANTGRLHLIGPDDHHSMWLWKNPSESQFENVYGDTVENYLKHCPQYKLIYDDNLLKKFVNFGWVRVAYDYETSPCFLVMSDDIRSASKALRSFYKYVSDTLGNVHPTVELDISQFGYKKLFDENFYLFMKNGSIPRNLVA